LGPIIVVGRDEPVRVWHVAAEGDENVLTAYADFTRAIQLMGERRFAAAGELLESVLERLGEDRPTSIFLDRCRECIASPPGEDWSAALRLTEK
jgi:adenylate cyclase